MKPIGLQLYSLREEAKGDFVGVLKKVAKFGYAGVETAGLHGMTAGEVRKVLDDLGLICCSTHGPFPNADNVAQRVDEAAVLGTDLIISGLGRDAFKTADVCKGSIDKLAEAARLVADAGMKFGYHNHYWEFDLLEGRMPYDIILKAVPGMFSQLDIYWASNFGKVDVPAVVKANAARIPTLHVKDGPLVEGEPHMAVGAGKMDIAGCIHAADESVLRWLVVELDHCGTDMATAVHESCKYLVDQGLGKGR